jgi:hypothetical protein
LSANARVIKANAESFIARAIPKAHCAPIAPAENTRMNLRSKFRMIIYKLSNGLELKRQKPR